LYQEVCRQLRRLRARVAPVLVVMAFALVAACSGVSNPAGPGDVPASFSVPDFLIPSLELIDSDPRAVPMLDEPAGPWLRRVARGVIVDTTLPSHVRAQCCRSDRLIRWSTGWIPDVNNPRDVRIAAAILIHEGRHGEGFLHTCPDQQRDRTFDEGGAWALHATWLRHGGDVATADSIARSDIGCR
jgi:hypothetical protein